MRTFSFDCPAPGCRHGWAQVTGSVVRRRGDGDWYLLGRLCDWRTFFLFLPKDKRKPMVVKSAPERAPRRR